MNLQTNRIRGCRIAKLAIAAGLSMGVPAFAGSIFSAGNLVVSVEGNGSGTGNYTGNQAAPLTLYQYTTAGTYVNSLELPQVNVGLNFAVSGEYGSSSEGMVQLSGNGQYLTLMGYGINADTFNANPGAYGPSAVNTALAQSGSLTGQAYTAVPRVVALIDSNGNVNSTTALYNVFNGNNPRSVVTADGTNLYVSGQGNSPDHTGGVFYATTGGSSAVAITGDDTSAKTLTQDTRDVQIINGQLYVSVDSKEGSNSARSFIGTLGSAGSLPTTLANSGNGPTQLTGFGTSATGKYTITAGTTNGINSAGQQINLSPEGYYFANSTTLYVADSGNGKQNSATSNRGAGGLQKWSLVSGTWVLDYTLSAGLNLVANPVATPANTHGTTGLLSLAGQVAGNQVQLFATNYVIGDLDQTYLYSITDLLSATTLPTGLAAESFAQLAAAPADSSFKGVSFTQTVDPAPEPATFALLGLGTLGVLILRRRA